MDWRIERRIERWNWVGDLRIKSKCEPRNPINATSVFLHFSLR